MNNCSFCLVFLPGEPELHNHIGNDFFGEPATIGDMPSCEACAIVADTFTEKQRGTLIGAAKRSCAAHQIAHFFADLAELLLQAVEVAREALLQEVNTLDPEAIEQAQATAIEANPLRLWPDDRLEELVINLAGYQMWLIVVAGGSFSCLHVLKICDTCAALTTLYAVAGYQVCAACIEPPADAPGYLVEFDPATETVEVLGLVDPDDAGMVTVRPPLIAGA